MELRIKFEKWVEDEYIAIDLSRNKIGYIDTITRHMFNAFVAGYELS